MTLNAILIDNYDSFTYNLVDAFESMGVRVSVFRHHVPVSDLKKMLAQIKGPKCLILSPGPGSPQTAGLCLDYVKFLQNECPILGICLGHQVIAEAFGGKVDCVNPIHGEASSITHDGHPLFESLPSPFQAGRYHSLAVEAVSPLKVIAKGDNLVMGIAHTTLPIYGLQFHPESILTEFGPQLLANVVKHFSEIQQEVNHAA